MRRTVTIFGLVGIMLILSAITACSASPVAAPNVDTSHIGTRTKTSGCVIQGALPDPACTPGAIFPDATQEQICKPGYSQNVRDVPDSEKNEVYAEYGIREHTAGEYEVDHLISLELGGSNDIANLWPEAAEPRPGFHEKDKVENELHDEVCQGTMTLSEAQAGIANYWLAFYSGFVPTGSNKPQATSTAGRQSQATPTAGNRAQATAPATGHRFVASSRARQYYYCDSDPAWQTLSSADLVWSDDEATFQSRGLELHRPCQ